MSKVKITEQDVGRKFRDNSGVVNEVVEWYEFNGKGCVRTRACDNDCGLSGLADNGKYHRNGGGSPYDFKEWISEDIYKSVNTKEITEADIGREFLTRDGSKCKVIYFSLGNSPVAVKVISWVKGVSVKDHRPYYFFTTLGQYLYNREPHHLDFKEWAYKDEKMENKIELKVGQKVKFRNGGTGTVISYGTGVLRNQPFKVHHNERGVNFWYTVNGEWSEIKSESPFDIIEILEEAEGEKMAENLKEKYERLINRRFKNEDGDVVTITSVDVENDSVLIKFNDDEQEYSSTLKDIDEMLENAEEVTGQQEEADLWDDDEVAEEQDKYELRLTVVDAKGSATTDKSYCNDAGIVGDLIHEKTDKLIKLKSLSDGLSPFTNLLRAKGDVVKITRQINILNVNIATITIRVTKLED